MTERPWMLLAAGVYLVVVLAIGVWAARRTRSAKDFFIAGQGVGLLVTALATMSAGFSGFLFVGGPGLTYRLGTAAFLICFPVSFTAGMLCWVAARRLRLLAGVRPVYTLPDALLARFRCRRTSGLAALAVLLGTVGYLGAQLLALGILVEEVVLEQVMEQVAPLRDLLGGAGPWPGLLLGAAVVLAYATAGGMVAGVYTDLVQGLLMIGAAVGVFFLALDVGGGVEGITSSIARSERFGAAFLDPLGVAPWTAVSFFFVFAVGLLGQPHTLHKFFMLDDPRKLRWLPLVLGLSQTLVVLIWIAIGLAVPALVAEGRLAPLARPDDASPTFLLEFVPPALAGVVFAAVLAAIMSTADSFVNLAAAALVRDLPRAFGRKPGAGDDARELRHGRRAVVAVTVASAILAGVYGDLVGLLGTLAYGTFAAALAPVIAVGLGWRGCTARAASASIAVGLGLNVGLELAERAGWDPVPAGVLPSAPALAASFVVLLVVGLVDGSRGREEAIDDDVWRAVGPG